MAGGSGDDSLSGNAGDDIAFGGSGADTMDGGAGSDTLVGGTGDDSIEGGLDSDALFGGEGSDTLSTGDGDDSAYGGAGDDSIVGGDGNDVLSGGDGADTVDGGAGIDTIFGGAGSDSLEGGAGDDEIHGGEGADTISAGSGDDLIEGGAGSDSIDGGDGSDTITGDEGSDIIDGGIGSDLITGGAGNDTISGGSGSDTIQGNSGDDSIDGGDGQDLLVGGTGNDTISGGSGDDLVVGGEGNNQLSGGAGHDYVIGGDGSDNLQGDAGDDHVYGGAGDDTIDGGDGADTLFGGEGSDVITGGAGDDVIYADDGAFIINESSDFSGWNDNTTESGATGEYLGRHGDSDGDQSLHKTFDISEAEGTVTVEFDILEIDDWEGSGSYADELTVFVNDQPVLLQSYDVNVDDGDANSGGLSDLGYGGSANDEIHHIKMEFNINEDGSLTLLNPDGSESSTVVGSLPDASSLKLGFGADMSGSVSNESWGVDNVKISSGSIEAGNDTISGGAGDDMVVFQGSSSEYNITENPDGTFTIEDTVTDRDGTDVLDQVEFVQFSDGTFDINDFGSGSSVGPPPGSSFNEISGSSGDNSLYGGSGDDHIEGMSGDDNIYAGSGDDFLEGGSGDDYFQGQWGDDTIDGGGGNDTAAFSGSIHDFTITKNEDGSYTMQDNIAGRSGTDLVDNIENFNFSGSNYTVEEIDASHLDNDLSSSMDFDIPAASSGDWTTEIASDDNFTAVDPSSWLDDANIDTNDENDDLEVEPTPDIQDSAIVLPEPMDI